MPACKSGSTSGWTCGVVTADKVTESVNDNGELLDVYGFHFSAFLLSGDSGGAIVSGHYRARRLSPVSRARLPNPRPIRCT